MRIRMASGRGGLVGSKRILLKWDKWLDCIYGVYCLQAWRFLLK